MKKNLVLFIVSLLIVSMNTNCAETVKDESGPLFLEVVPPDFEPDRSIITFDYDGDPYQIEILGNILLTIWGQSRRDVEDENFSP